MKKILFIITIYFSNAILHAQALSEYTFISTYSDNFISSSINPHLWMTDNWGDTTWCQEGVHFKTSCVTTGNSSSSDPSNTSGFLRIIPYKTNIADAPSCDNKNYAHTYNSGRLCSKSWFRYGYYETRVKLLTDGRGCSAWWFHGGCQSGTSWATALYNEMDAFETAYHNQPFGTAFLYGTGSCSYETDYSINVGSILSNNPMEAFHVIGLEWMPEYINVYIDGTLYRTIQILKFTKGDNRPSKLYGEITTVRSVATPSLWDFWVKRADNEVSNNWPDGTTDIFEADYFKFYKPNPILRNGIYTSSSSITLKATSVEPTDVLTWSVSSGNATISSQNLGSAVFNLPSGFTSSVVTVSSVGDFPSGYYTPPTTSTSYNLIKSDGNICSVSGSNQLYFATNFTAPQSGCSATVIATGDNISFVANNGITLNAGFEVQLGGTFTAAIE